jgi:hypothetical protein
LCGVLHVLKFFKNNFSTQGALIVVNENPMSSQYDIISLNPNSMVSIGNVIGLCRGVFKKFSLFSQAQQTIVSLPPQYADSNGATAIYQGVLYFACSNGRDTINTLAIINLMNGNVSYVPLGGNSIVAMLPPNQ